MPLRCRTCRRFTRHLNPVLTIASVPDVSHEECDECFNPTQSQGATVSRKTERDCCQRCRQPAETRKAKDGRWLCHGCIWFCDMFDLWEGG